MNQNGTKIFTASFTGKMYDAEAGMYYFNARWYDSEIGRFITEDPARDGIDWYAYCNNNPLRFLDPTGLNPKDNEQTNNDLSAQDEYKISENITTDVRNVYETTSNFIRIDETVNNTDINFSLNIMKYDTVRKTGKEETKIDVSMYVENSVGQESRENYGLFSKFALASELNVLIKFDNKTLSKNNLANADEGNSFTVYIPRTNNPSLIIDLCVIAINQKNITETFNYEVNFK